MNRMELEAMRRELKAGKVPNSIVSDRDFDDLLALALEAEGYRARVAELEAALTEQGLLQKRADGSMVWHAHDCPASFDFAQCNYRCRVARAVLGEKP